MIANRGNHAYALIVLNSSLEMKTCNVSLNMLSVNSAVQNDVLRGFHVTFPMSSVCSKSCCI